MALEVLVKTWPKFYDTRFQIIICSLPPICAIFQIEMTKWQANENDGRGQMAIQGGVIASKEEWRQHKYILGNWSNGKTRNSYNKQGKTMVMQRQASSRALFLCFETLARALETVFCIFEFSLFLEGNLPIFVWSFLLYTHFLTPASLCEIFCELSNGHQIWHPSTRLQLSIHTKTLKRSRQTCIPNIFYFNKN